MSYTFAAKGSLTKRRGKSIFITCFPGIGNIGRISAEYLRRTYQPARIGHFIAEVPPAISVINEEHVMAAPEIILYYLKRKQVHVYICSGDYQPREERELHDLCGELIATARTLGVDEIVATGGIGLAEAPADPQVYVTGPRREHTERYDRAHTQIHGVVGSIMGITGILPLRAHAEGIASVVLLAETLAHEGYAGLDGARRVLETIDAAHDLDLDLTKLDQDIDEALEGLGMGGGHETSYIG